MGPLGLPVRTFRVLAFSSGGTEQEDSSSYYRVLENHNLEYTLHQASPWTGIGFGHKFLVSVPLPRLNAFAWWEYFPINSILWIWLAAGAGGFFALLFLIGWAILLGVQNLSRIPDPDLRAIALTATLYIIMHFIYAYVDISFNFPSMVYVGMMLGLLNILPRIAPPVFPVQEV
jgi:O-antigen ligase